MAVRTRRVFTGLKRDLVRKLRNALGSIVAMDARAKKLAQAQSTVPVLFATSPTVKAAITALQAQVTAAMEAKA